MDMMPPPSTVSASSAASGTPHPHSQQQQQQQQCCRTAQPLPLTLPLRRPCRRRPSWHAPGVAATGRVSVTGREREEGGGPGQPHCGRHAWTLRWRLYP